jgi:hypothetical protein
MAVLIRNSAEMNVKTSNTSKYNYHYLFLFAVSILAFISLFIFSESIEINKTISGVGFGIVICLFIYRGWRQLKEADIQDGLITESIKENSLKIDNQINDAALKIESWSNERFFLSYFIGRKLGVHYQKISDLAYKFENGSYHVTFFISGESKALEIEQISLMAYQHIASLPDCLNFSSRLFSKYLNKST